MDLKGRLFVLFIYMAICFIFISCGEAPANPEEEIIDISDKEVLDAYVDIDGAATPSIYTTQEHPLQLPPFSTILSVTFLESETSVFIVEFMGEQYNIDFGTLELELTEAESGKYPMAIVTSARSSSRNRQTQIWIEVNNGFELPEVNIDWLEKNR